MDFNWTTFEDVDLPAQTREWGRIINKQAVLSGVCRKCLQNRPD